MAPVLKTRHVMISNSIWKIPFLSHSFAVNRPMFSCKRKKQLVWRDVGKIYNGQLRIADIRYEFNAMHVFERNDFCVDLNRCGTYIFSGLMLLRVFRVHRIRQSQRKRERLSHNLLGLYSVVCTIAFILPYWISTFWPRDSLTHEYTVQHQIDHIRSDKFIWRYCCLFISYFYI